MSPLSDGPFKLGLEAYQQMAMEDPIVKDLQKMIESSRSAPVYPMAIPKHPCDCLYPPARWNGPHLVLLVQSDLWWPICYQEMTGEDLLCDHCRGSWNCRNDQTLRRSYKAENGHDVPHLTHEQANEFRLIRSQEAARAYLATLERSSTSS